jgi:hypothetical protein
MSTAAAPADADLASHADVSSCGGFFMERAALLDHPTV